MERKVYPSDISQEQFEVIRPLLEGARRRTAPRRVDLYDVFCAILYLLKNGGTWRAIPGDVPGWNRVRYYFDQWTACTAGDMSLFVKGESNFPQVRELNFPHPVHAWVSSGRTRPAFNFSFKRYELLRILSVTT